MSNNLNIAKNLAVSLGLESNQSDSDVPMPDENLSDVDKTNTDTQSGDDFMDTDLVGSKSADGDQVDTDDPGMITDPDIVADDDSDESDDKYAELQKMIEEDNEEDHMSADEITSDPDEAEQVEEKYGDDESSDDDTSTSTDDSDDTTDSDEDTDDDSDDSDEDTDTSDDTDSDDEDDDDSADIPTDDVDEVDEDTHDSPEEAKIAKEDYRILRIMEHALVYGQPQMEHYRNMVATLNGMANWTNGVISQESIGPRQSNRATILHEVSIAKANIRRFLHLD